MDYGAAYGDSRVVVTGASGFIGHHLCSHLARLGATVFRVSKEDSVESTGSGEFHEVDICDFTAVRRCFDYCQPDVVINGAAFVSGDRSVDQIQPTIEVNTIGAINVMRAAVETSRPRVVLCGSMEEPPVGSEHEAPASPYAASKLAARLFGQLFGFQYDLEVVMTRLFMVYGPGPQSEQRLIPYTIQSIMAGESPKYTSGDRNVDWIFVDDVVRALALLGISDNVSGQVFDIGSGTFLSIRSVVEAIFAAMDADSGPVFGELADRAGETEHLADWSPLNRAVGWSPTVAFEDGLRQTIDWFKRGGEGSSKPG